MKPRFRPQYSGPCSKPFWRAVHSLNELERDAAYFAGVLLQNMENQVLRNLENALRTAKPIGPRPRRRK